MKIQIFSALAAAAMLLLGCTEKDSQRQDPVIPEESGLPELPADPQPDNLSFDHRIMLLQHTGTYCPNCPRLMSSLKQVAEDKNYSDRYHHVASHSYNEEGDAAYSSAAANISQAFCSGYYPELTFNLTKESTGTSIEPAVIKSKIDELHKESADVGIAAAAAFGNGSMNVNVEIKAAKENLYRIAVWVLEDGIESEQEGASEAWQHTHNNAVRAMAGESLNLRIYGIKTGTLQAGSKHSHGFNIKIEDDWKPEKCKALIIVNAADNDGKYDLVNCAVCPIGSSITYDYK